MKTQIINLDGIVSQLSTTLLSAAIKLGHNELQLATEFLDGLKSRFANYVNKLTGGQITLSDVTEDLKNEKSLLIIQVETLGIIAGSAVQDAIDNVIGIFVGEITKLDTTKPTYIAGNFSYDRAATPLVADITGSRETTATPPTIAPSTVQYGVFFSNSLESPNDIIQVAKKLGVSTIRMGLNLDSYSTGKAIGYNTIKNAGFKLQLNINWKGVRMAVGERYPQPCPTTPQELQDYATGIDQVLTDIKADIVVIENEFMVDMMHSGIQPQYTAQAKVAAGVCKKHGIPCTNSGDTKPGIIGAAYLYFKNDSVSSNAKDAAKFIYNNGMDKRTQKAVDRARGYDKTLAAKFDEAKALMMSYKGAGLDFANLHWYEPLIPKTFLWMPVTSNTTSGCLKYIVQWANAVSGLPVISNECGVTSASALLVSNLLQDMKDSNVGQVTFFSSVSENGTTYPLNNDLDLNAMGEAFASFVK